MRTRISAALALAAAWLASSAIQATAEELSLESYNSLLSRIEALEADNAAMVQGMHNGGGCSGGCVCCKPRCTPACYPNGFYGSVEAVVVTPYFSRNAAFYVENDTSIPVDNFNEVSFDRDLEFSPRFEVGSLNECGMGWRVRYWNFDDDVVQAATGDNYYASFSGGDDQVEIEIDGDTSIEARHSLDMDVLDLEASKLWQNLLFSAGLRYALMEQSYQAIGDSDEIRGDHDFEGVGPTLALEVYQPVSCRFSLFAKVRGSLLYGESSYVASDSVILDSDLQVRNNDEDLVAVSEIQLGARWMKRNSCGGAFFITTALEAQYWANAGTGLPGRVGTDDGNYIDQTSQEADLGFFGFNVGAGFVR
jgi:hypothetical protein